MVFPRKISVYFLIYLALFLIGNFPLANAAWVQPPQQFTNDQSTITMDGATDGHGNAIAIWGDSDGVVASYFTNSAWGPNQILGSSTSTSNLQVAMDATGTGIALWEQSSNLDLKSSYFVGGNWTTPTPDPLHSGPQLQIIGLSMNGIGQGIGGWVTFTSPDVVVSFFNAGTWSAPTVIGTSAFPLYLYLAYAPDGTAMASWIDSDITAAYYDGVVWQPSQIIGTGFQLGQLAMDASGNAITAWIDNPSGNVIARTFDGTTATWLPPQTVDNSFGNTAPSIAMAPGGTAVLTWLDISFNGWSSSYNGTSWSTPVQFASNITDNPSVSVDSNGNALVIYPTSTPSPQIASTQLPLGGVFTPQLVVTNPIDSQGSITTFFVISALSSNGVGFAFWLPNIEGTNAYGSVLFPIPAPAINLKVKACDNNFANQSERINIISWTPSADPLITSYYLRRNGTLIAVIPASGPFTYHDRKRCKKKRDVYTLTSLNSMGTESDPLTIVQ